MNKKIPFAAAIALTACLFLFNTGCKTPGVTTPPGIASPAALLAMQSGAQIGTYITISKHPESRVYFESATVVIGTLINSGPVDTASILAALDGMKVEDVEARMAITTALQFYQLQWGQAVAANIDAKTYCIPILTAFRTGILAGLDPVGSETTLGLKIKK